MSNELSKCGKTGAELRAERRIILDKYHLGLSGQEKQRLKELDDLIEQLPANESQRDRKLMEQIRKTAKLLKLEPDNAKSEIGIAVGLIDTIINSARILRKMSDESVRREIDKRHKGKLPLKPPKEAKPLPDLISQKEVIEAIKDFYQDADVKRLFVEGVRITKTKITI